MTEKEVCHHCPKASPRQSKSQILRLFCGNIEHYKIGGKKDHRASKISGKHQDAHMKSRHYSCLHNRAKIVCSGKQRGCKKHKGNFNNLRGLNSHQRQFCSVACSCKKKNCRKQDDAHSCVKPGKPSEKFHFPDHNRNDQRDSAGCRRDHKLFRGCGDIQSAKHDKSHA